jgi:hypothetical protein
VKTSERSSSNSSAFSSSLFATGTLSVEYLRIWRDVWVLSHFSRFPNRVIFHFEISDVFYEGYILGVSWSFDLNLLLVRLYVLLLSGV